ncbi:MAG: hypothetical protein GC181_01705 [Bacteroidetes bacterium]|nr:hypothetical protein [Bacteroidota bacterium]
MELHFNEIRVGEVVRYDYRTADIFRSFNIEYCCAGSKLLGKVCEEYGIDPDDLRIELNAILELQGEGISDEMDFVNWDHNRLLNQIETVHHVYAHGAIPVIRAQLTKLVQIYGDQFPQLSEIEKDFIKASGSFKWHMRKEELVFFPLLRRWFDSPLKSGEEISMYTPILEIIKEHETEVNLFKGIRNLCESVMETSGEYVMLKDCMQNLIDFFQDMELHLHLENNILFPKVIQMERGLVESGRN